MTSFATSKMEPVTKAIGGAILLTSDLDYNLVRASMVMLFFFFGYKKWWPYEAR
jgi:uncharacterized membrane protein YkgB